jgi:hypothetical protein
MFLQKSASYTSTPSLLEGARKGSAQAVPAAGTTRLLEAGGHDGVDPFLRPSLKGVDKFPMTGYSVQSTCYTHSVSMHAHLCLEQSTVLALRATMQHKVAASGMRRVTCCYPTAAALFANHQQGISATNFVCVKRALCNAYLTRMLLKLVAELLHRHDRHSVHSRFARWQRL